MDIDARLVRLLHHLHAAQRIPCIVCSCGIVYGWGSRDACWCPDGGNILAGVFALTLCSGNLIILKKKCVRFHALIKIISDYQAVTKRPVAASRCCKRLGEGAAVSRLG